MLVTRTIPQKCQNCGRYFVTGEVGDAEDKAELLQRRGRPTMMLGNIIGDDMKCVCGAEVRTEVTGSVETCFICARKLGRRWRPHEGRWNAAGNSLALMCQPCLKKEDKQITLDKKLGRDGGRQFPEWDDDGNIVTVVIHGEGAAGET